MNVIHVAYAGRWGERETKSVMRMGGLPIKVTFP